jgi:hypothetical protein
MPSLRAIVIFCGLGLLSVCYSQFTRGAETDEEIRIDAPKDWRGERIELPPSFAPDLKLKGVEEIRFAPGMFRPEAKDFFSYVIVFRLDGEPKLPQKTLESELLVYYRGLAKAVGRGKIKTDDFSIDIKPVENAKTPGVQQYIATLKWVEPFATKKPQTLRIEIRAWSTPKDRRSWIFMSVSPQKTDNPVWKTMHKIRDDFVKK